MVIFMAMNKKATQEELPFPIEGVNEEENKTEQVSFDELDYEAEYTEN